MCSCTATKQHSNESATDNSQPMSDIVNRQAATTYDTLDVNRQRPVNYQQLPPQTGDGHGYYNIGSSANTNTDTTPYEQLDIHAQRPAVYDKLSTKNNR